LIEEEVSPYRLRGDAGITLSGPEYVINAKASLSLSLVLHELTTNAIKHGSLSVPDGRLSIVWKKVSRDGAEWLEIAWSESGGPAVRQPSRKGFGRTLLERVFAHDVHGAATLRFDPAGVICTLMIPFSSVLPPKHHQFGIPEIETAASPVSGKPLEGLRVFVMEDNALVAAEMVDALIEKGAVVLGPFHSLASGGVAATEQAFDVALLDVDIDGAAVWPVAKLIKNRGIPAVFATGFSNHSLRPTEFQNSQTIAKPYQADDITNVLLRACGRIAGEGKRR
jgi:CheY-like chemotaxis protein